MTYDKMLAIDTQGIFFTVKAAGTVSGGDLLQWVSGATSVNAVGSVMSTYAGTEPCVIQHADTTGEQFCGIALNPVTSGLTVAVALEGIYILPAGSNGVSGGMPVSPVGYANCVERTPTGSVALRQQPIGRALTAATANGQFAIVKLSV
jgi:predicted RecA/RadA family phage recombinase